MMNNQTATLHTYRLVMAQLNLWVGDIEGNAQRVLNAIQTARDTHHANGIIFPELTLSGYPPQDLLFHAEFHDRIEAALQTLLPHIHDIDVLLGFPHKKNDQLYNAAAWLRDAQCRAIYYKQRLPNYAVFDEVRYFNAGTQTCLIELNGLPTAIVICEDLWFPETLQKIRGARLIIALNASPFHQGKHAERQALIRTRIQEIGIPIIYTNLVGAQDELIFDGHSFAMDQHGTLCVQAPSFCEGLYPVSIEWTTEHIKLLSTPAPIPGNEIAILYEALVLGLQDYLKKNKFSSVILGLSGGIDSALTLAIAVDALSPSQVHTVMLPSRHTSSLSLTLAASQAELLNVSHRSISITPLIDAYRAQLSTSCDSPLSSVTEQNLQARARGALLMALSNQENHLLLCTTNKSELATGYGTLYGDLIGGFAVLKDVLKTQVYALAKYRNQRSSVIPAEVLTRAPTAELAPNQVDTDSLPPYDLLDSLLTRHIEHNDDLPALITAGFDQATAERVLSLVNHSEYKRQQSPLGSKVSSRAFGKDWRYPISKK